MVSWSCKMCGACCEFLPLFTTGEECPKYNKENRTCKIYDERPAVCVVAGHPFGEEITERFCQIFRNIIDGDNWEQMQKELKASGGIETSQRLRFLISRGL